MNLEIGTKVYPNDNSFSFNITKDEESKVFLAGRNTPIEDAKLVEIISEPFEEYLPDWNETYEFVHVKYEGDIYRILNNFCVEKSESNNKSDYLT